MKRYIKKHKSIYYQGSLNNRTFLKNSILGIVKSKAFLEGTCRPITLEALREFTLLLIELEEYIKE